jgi:transposase-like protein
MFCGCKHTPEKKHHGYDATLRQQAIRLYVDGLNLRRTGRHLGVHHSTISIWVKAHVNQLAQTPQPQKVKTAERDEWFTFLGNKKTKST